MKINRQYLYRALFGLYILAVCILCFIKPDSIPSKGFDWFGLPADKVGHFLMFLPFPILSFNAFVKDYGTGTDAFFRLMVIVLAGAAIAIGTELIQKVLGYRSFDLHDFLCDIAGILAGTVVATLFIAIKKRK